MMRWCFCPRSWILILFICSLLGCISRLLRWCHDVHTDERFTRLWRARLADGQAQRAAVERRTFAQAQRMLGLLPIQNPPAWVRPFADLSFFRGDSQRSWTAEVLKVPPGSLIRHNSDDNDNTHDKDDDADAAAAGVTRAAGSRPSSEEMLRRGYMLRKGETLSCKMLILTDGEMRKAYDKNEAVEALSSWSRQNHIAYAAERGYCIVHARCVVAGDQEGVSVEGVMPAHCGDHMKFLGYGVLIYLIKEVLIDPAESYVAKMDLDAFVTNFESRFEDVITSAEEAITRRQESNSKGFIPQLFESAIPQAVEPGARVSFVISIDPWACTPSTPHNSGVTLWRGSEVALAILYGVLERHAHASVLRGDQRLVSAELEENFQLRRHYSSIACRHSEEDHHLAAPGVVLNWSPDGAAVVVTTRTFNSPAGQPYHPVHGWMPGDFVAHFWNLNAKKRFRSLEVLCGAIAADRQRVCPWL